MAKSRVVFEYREYKVGNRTLFEYREYKVRAKPKK